MLFYLFLIILNYSGGLISNNPTLDTLTEIHSHNKGLEAKVYFIYNKSINIFSI